MNWLDGIIGAVLGIIGTIIVAVLKFKSASDSTTSQARDALQGQTLEYARMLEESRKHLEQTIMQRLEDERKHCDMKMEEQAIKYERRIAELEDEVAQLKEAVKLRKNPRPSPSSSRYEWPDDVSGA